MLRDTRPVSWLKAASRGFEAFPDGARLEVARALRFQGDAYRVVYALRIGDDIWIVHAFQKKSKTGIKTPKSDIDLIDYRLKRLKEMLK